MSRPGKASKTGENPLSEQVSPEKIRFSIFNLSDFLVKVHAEMGWRLKVMRRAG